MDWTERRRRFRGILEGEACVHPGSVFDPISARIAEDLGFEVGMFAGSVASLTVLGAPDIVVLTLSEFAQQILRITRAGSIPLLVDADHGYGNAMSVMRTVRELETAGVAGMTIEDTALPTGFGAKGTTLLSREEGLGKIRAALAARADPALAIVARTSALGVTDTDDAVARLKGYEAAGADALFLAGAKSADQVRAVRAATKLPLVLGGATGDTGDRAAMAAMGVRIALQGHQPFMAAVQAVHATLKALRDGVAPGALTGLPEPGLMKRVTRAADYDAAAKDFLGG